MQAKIPVLAVTDPNTDIGKIIMEGEFGWWCESKDVYEFTRLIKEINTVNEKKLLEMKLKEWNYLEEKYSSEICYNIIFKHMSIEY